MSAKKIAITAILLRRLASTKTEVSDVNVQKVMRELVAFVLVRIGVFFFKNKTTNSRHQ